MDLGIKDRVAVVAASSRGLGRATAEALAAEGARIALCAREEKALRETAGEIRSRYGVPVAEKALDVTDYDAVRAFLSEVREKLGPVSICVTNAGGPPGGKFADFGPDDWRKAFELNFMSTLFLIREVLPGMREQKWGRVVTITSVSVKQPIDGLILSNSIRGAVVGLMKSLANEYGGDGVLFNNVCPGNTATERLLSLAGKRADAAGITRNEMLERMSQSIPLGRPGRPEEFGAVVAFLCSEKASYVTGTSTLIDGGLAKGI